MFFNDCIHRKVRCLPSHSFNGEQVPFLPAFVEIFFAFSGLWHCIRHLAKISWTFLPSIDKWEIESQKNGIEWNFFRPHRFMATYRQSAKNFSNFFPPQVLGGTFEPKVRVLKKSFSLPSIVNGPNDAYLTKLFSVSDSHMGSRRVFAKRKR